METWSSLFLGEMSAATHPIVCLFPVQRYSICESSGVMVCLYAAKARVCVNVSASLIRQKFACIVRVWELPRRRKLKSHLAPNPRPIRIFRVAVSLGRVCPRFRASLLTARE